MNAEGILYTILGVAIFLLCWRFSASSKEKQEKQKIQKALALCEKQRRESLQVACAEKLKSSSGLSEKKQELLPFEERWKTGVLPCDGTLCNDKHPCSESERWFCRDVISKVVPQGYFVGQFWVQLRSGPRRVDFAIETLEGKKIVVEFDGYTAHVKDLKRADFDDQLLRQNELVCAGWTVLRFSFDQLNNNAKQCRHLLQGAVTDEYNILNKTPILIGKCLAPECRGEVHKLKSKEDKLFWKCQTCEKTFNYDKIAPLFFNRSCDRDDFLDRQKRS